MQSKIGAKQIWRIIYPWLIYDAVRYAVNILIIGIISVSGRDAAELLKDFPWINLAFTLISAAATLPIVIWFYQSDEKKRNAQHVFRKEGVSCSMTDWLLISITGISGCIALNHMVRMLSPILLTESYKNAAQTLYSDNGILQLATIVFVVPALEEIIFRGLIFGRMREWSRFGISAIVSALIFGVYHGNLYQGVYAFLFALILCMVYEKYGSLRTVIYMHGIVNATSLAATKLGVFQMDGMILAVAAVVTIIITGGGLAVIRRR